MPILVKCEEWGGESKITGFEDNFEVNTVQWGVGRGISSAYGTSTREGSTASISEVTLTKLTDKISVKLFEEALHGPLTRSVVISFVRQGAGNAPIAYVIVTLTGCGISSWSMSSGGERPTETMRLNFDKIEFKYDPIGDDLSGDPILYSWDLATGVGA